MFNKLQGSMQYLWSRLSLWKKGNYFELNKFKTLFMYSKNSILKFSLTLRRHCNFGPCSLVLWNIPMGVLPGAGCTGWNYLHRCWK